MEIMKASKMKSPVFGSIAKCIPMVVILSACAFAGPLQEAEIHKIVNDVRVVDSTKGSARPAAVKDVIAKDLAVRTGAQSRAELLFQDKTLTRLGAETYFSFKPGTRDMNLERGTMLLQVPKNLGGARIRAAAVTAAITGTTIMIENLPSKSVKVVVLEGSLKLSMNGIFGDSVVLKPGKMVILGAKDRRLPQPVTVDIAKLVKTSALIDPAKFSGGTATTVSPLPSMDLIEKEIAVQSMAKSKAQLAETNLLIQGDGAQVVMASAETMNELEKTGNVGKGFGMQIAADSSKRTQASDSRESLNTALLAKQMKASKSEKKSSKNSKKSEPTSFGNLNLNQLFTFGINLWNFDTITVAGDANVGSIQANTALDIGGTLTNAPSDGTITLDAPSIVVGGGANIVRSTGDGGELRLVSNFINIGPLGINGISVNGRDATLPGETGKNGGSVLIDTTRALLFGDVSINAPIFAMTGRNGAGEVNGGYGGEVEIAAKGNISVDSRIQVSDNAGTRVSKTGGDITLTSSKTYGTAIEVKNSGELLSLLNTTLPRADGGKITFTSQGGDIRVSGGTIAAEGGTVDMRNQGANGNVHVNNASIRGDTVKIGAFGSGGQLLIGGGSISADTTMKLYAGSATGKVRFTDNVTLGGNSAKTIAGMTVTIDPSKVVTVGGTSPVNIFTNVPDYSGPGGTNPANGSFGGQGAALPQPFNARPNF